MKKTLLSLLTTVAFAAPTFAAEAAGVESPRENSNTTAQTWTPFGFLDTPKHKATCLLSRFADRSNGDGISLEQVKEAINQGGSFAGNSRFSASPLHQSAGIHSLELFQPFLEACLNKDPSYLTPTTSYTDAHPFHSLLHCAAWNSDYRVAQFLMEVHDMKRDRQKLFYVSGVFIETVYPLFHAIRFNNDTLIQLLSVGLSESQIKYTEEQVMRFNTRIQQN